MKSLTGILTYFIFVNTVFVKGDTSEKETERNTDIKQIIDENIWAVRVMDYVRDHPQIIKKDRIKRIKMVTSLFVLTGLWNSDKVCTLRMLWHNNIYQRPLSGKIWAQFHYKINIGQNVKDG